ncbi:hypothetical protein Tco_1487618 [Tanacetum coccineum]
MGWPLPTNTDLYKLGLLKEVSIPHAQKSSDTSPSCCAAVHFPASLARFSHERTPQYPCSNLVLVESSFGTLVDTSMDGPAGLVFGLARAALRPAELAQKTPN